MNMTDTYTAQDWLAAYGVSYDWHSHGYQIEDGWEHQVYTIELEREGRKIVLPFSAGLTAAAEMPNGPTPDEVLPLYVRDIQNVQSWGEWAEGNGYDDPMEAPVRAYNVWESSAKLRRELYDFCTSQAMFEDFERIEEVDADTDDE